MQQINWLQASGSIDINVLNLLNIYSRPDSSNFCSGMALLDFNKYYVLQYSFDIVPNHRYIIYDSTIVHLNKTSNEILPGCLLSSFDNRLLEQ